MTATAAARPMTHPVTRHESHHGRVVRCFVDRPPNLAGSLAAAAGRAPDREAVVDGARRISYRALAARVDRLAAGLADMGVAAGDRIAMLLGNRLEVTLIAYAAATIGAIVVPMSLHQTEAETAWRIRHSGARLLFHEAGAALPAAAETPGLAWRLAVDDNAVLPGGDPRAFPPVAEDAPFCILYTSGTTGEPKGAILTHLNILHSVLHYRHHYGLSDGERMLLAVPASHVTGLVAIVAAAVEVAGCLIVMRAFKAARFLELAAAERMSCTLMVPAMYVLALMEPGFDAAALGHWRIGGFGGAPMPDATVADLNRRLPRLRLHNTYGATETTSPAVIMPAAAAAAHSRQVGLPVTCADVIAMDPDGREAPRGESGELWIAGPMVSPGYWDNDAANRNSFIGGYWKSGDIGSIDADGFVAIHDRQKDMINRGGYKIWSAEVENTLMAHPAVVEAAVVGRPCPVLGERVVAFVHLSGAADAEMLREHCARTLSDYKVPETIRFSADPLPRNSNGKLMKAVLRAETDRFPS